MGIFLSRTHGENNYNRKASVSKQVNTNKKQGSRRKSSAVSRNSLNNKLVKKNNIVSRTKPAIVSGQETSTNLGSLILNNVFRLAIIGVGMGTIFGSILANIDLTKPLFPKINVPLVEGLSAKKTEISTQKETTSTDKEVVKESEAKDININNQSLVFSQELTPLKNKFTELKAKYPKLEPGAFFVDLDNGAYVNFNGVTTFSAASTIKIPVLVAFFQDVDAGKIYLDEKLTISPSNIGSGSGGMQYQPVGTQYSAINTATEMIINSDNTATNMIIERLGGKDELNRRFKEWGLDVTVINNPLPDLEGTNMTSPRDLAMILVKVNQGELISLRSRDRLLEIMRQTRTRTLLPRGIKNMLPSPKTGDIGTVLGDAGIVDIPTGKRYIGSVLVKRSHNDYSARTLIQEISRTSYQHLKWYSPHPPLNK